MLDREAVQHELFSKTKISYSLALIKNNIKKILVALTVFFSLLK